MPLQTLRNQRPNRHRLKLEHPRAGFDACQVEQIENEQVKSFRLLPNLLQKDSAMFGIVDGAIEQILDVDLDDRQGRLEFVGDVGHEVLPHSFETAQFGGVVQDEDDIFLITDTGVETRFSTTNATIPDGEQDSCFSSV